MTQRFFPMLSYADAPSALDFLTNAFGFEETMRMEGENGTIGHAEPVDQEYGERNYRATDPEGHRWIFASPLP